MALMDYDDWYDRYGIQQLLSERMEAKERKKTTKKARSVMAGKDNRPVAKRNSIIKPGSANYQENALSVQWGTISPTDFLHMHGAPSECTTNQTAICQTPVLKLTPAPYALFTSPGSCLRSSYEPWPQGTDIAGAASLPANAAKAAVEADSDRSKLKGAQWPGMSVFDSATEAQKRKRNQRKDVSVLRQMERTSATTEPTETIWSEFGEVQRMRDIYATPSIEGSPEPKADVGNKRERKGSRRGPAAPSVPRTRKTRASTKKPRAKSVPKEKGKNKSRPEPAQESADNQFYMSIQNLMDDYDIFRDPPGSSPGRMGCPQSGGSFQSLSRPALQPLDANTPIVSSVPSSLKPSVVPYLHAEISAHVPPFIHHQSIGSGLLNPLALQSRSSFPYIPFGPQSFEDDTKSEGFQHASSTDGLSYSVYSESMVNSNPLSSSSSVHRDAITYDT